MNGLYILVGAKLCFAPATHVDILGLVIKEDYLNSFPA
jgi:hypothetical protein